MDQKIIKIHDKHFAPFIKFEEIDRAVSQIADRMNKELHDKNPLFIAILNGSFMFASDLFHCLLPIFFISSISPVRSLLLSWLPSDC